MATHPPSPPYAHLAPRPPTPPDCYPSVPAAASFLASYYAVPLLAEPESEPEHEQETWADDEAGIVSASAFLGHQDVSERKGSGGRGDLSSPEYVLHDVRSSLFPGQQFFHVGEDSVGKDCGVYGDHTWSANRGWTGPDVKDHDKADVNLTQGDTSLDIGYITTRLDNIITDTESPAQPTQTPTTQGPSARLIRRESGTASRSLSRQSSLRRASAIAPPAGEQQAASVEQEETPMSPASAFLSHFSPPITHTQAMAIPRSTPAGSTSDAPGDTTSEFSLSRMGSPTKYPHSDDGHAFRYVLGPLLGSGSGHPADMPFVGPRRSFSTSASFLAAYPTTMSTISSSSDHSHLALIGSGGSSTAPPDAAGSRVMGYTLGKVIGRGGFSTVRMAIDERTGQRVACRIIKRDDLSDQSGSLENFEIELEIWEEVSRVRHPRILPLLEKWRDPEGYATYLITPLMARGSLLDVIRREGAGEETARRWFPGIVEAVKALHCGWTGTDKDGAEQHAHGGYLHGDLKLDNFLVGENEGEICVCDFGLAQRIGPKSAAAAPDERRGRKEERRIILHSREASPERSSSALAPLGGTPTGSRQPSRSRPKLYSPYVSTTEVDLFHQHQHQQHVSRPSLPSFPVTSQLLHEHHQHYIHRPSRSRGRDVSPSPVKGRRASRSRTRRTLNPPHIPVQTFPSASLPYACPELLRAPPSPPDFAQDIWALGIILHALLTSRLPFVDAFDPRLQMKIIRGEWTVPPGLGNEWTECLRGCLEVDPRRRWDIEALAASDAVQGWQEAKSRSKSRSRSRARARTRVDLSPTDRLSSAGSRGAESLRARSRSRNRTDYFGHEHAAGTAPAATTPRMGRTRSRSNPAVAKLRDQGGYSHYDSPLELVPELEQPQDATQPPPPPPPPISTSPSRSRSSQSRHILTGTWNRMPPRIDSETGTHSTVSSRNGSAGRRRSRSRDPLAVSTGDVPAPRTSPARNRSRTRDS